MARIKITDLPKNMDISKDEIKKITGGMSFNLVLYGMVFSRTK